MGMTYDFKDGNGEALVYGKERVSGKDEPKDEPKLSTDPKARKATPLCTGVLDYFPDALAAVAEVSRVGNEQHNPGQPLHWERSKSADHEDCLLRHLVDRGKLDTDGMRHSAKVAWRAMAMLQLEIEKNRADGRTGAK